MKEQKHNFHVHKWHFCRFYLTSSLLFKNWEVRCHSINKDQKIFVHCVGLITRLIDWKLKNDCKNVIKSCIQESIRIKKVKRKCLITFDSDRMNCVLVMKIYIRTDLKIIQLYGKLKQLSFVSLLWIACYN